MLDIDGKLRNSDGPDFGTAVDPVKLMESLNQQTPG